MTTRMNLPQLQTLDSGTIQRALTPMGGRGSGSPASGALDQLRLSQAESAANMAVEARRQQRALDDAYQNVALGQLENIQQQRPLSFGEHLAQAAAGAGAGRQAVNTLSQEAASAREAQMAVLRFAERSPELGAAMAQQWGVQIPQQFLEDANLRRSAVLAHDELGLRDPAQMGAFLAARRAGKQIEEALTLAARTPKALGSGAPSALGTWERLTQRGDDGSETTYLYNNKTGAIRQPDLPTSAPRRDPQQALRTKAAELAGREAAQAVTPWQADQLRRRTQEYVDLLRGAEPAPPSASAQSSPPAAQAPAPSLLERLFSSKPDRMRGQDGKLYERRGDQWGIVSE